MSAISETVATPTGHPRQGRHDRHGDVGPAGADRATSWTRPTLRPSGRSSSDSPSSSPTGPSSPSPAASSRATCSGTSVLISRQSDGTVATFLNMCRHRGGKVGVEAVGLQAGLRLPVPRVGLRPGRRDAAQRALRGVLRADRPRLQRPRAGEDGGAPRVRLGRLLERPRPDGRRVPRAQGRGAARLVRAGRRRRSSSTRRSSWTSTGSSSSTAPSTSSIRSSSTRTASGSCSRPTPARGRTTAAMASSSRLASASPSWPSPASPSTRRGSTSRRNLVVYPNSMVIAAPDHVEFWSVWPSNETASRSITNIRFLVRPEILTDEMAATAAAELGDPRGRRRERGLADGGVDPGQLQGEPRTEPTCTGATRSLASTSTGSWPRTWPATPADGGSSRGRLRLPDTASASSRSPSSGPRASAATWPTWVQT